MSFYMYDKARVNQLIVESNHERVQQNIGNRSDLIRDLIMLKQLKTKSLVYLNNHCTESSRHGTVN